ncbi:PIN domain-containing protein [Chelativorans alearense]|uniref:PIN domain-containing protein n=1 Tax=Chelativorans alearense TaxID=2681495 RepID=UPI0013D1D2A5|nr:type II toxin-antitoxin system VapC family toxin [Chelativorans alearense]
MLGVDTSIIVRLLTRDDARQYEAVVGLIKNNKSRGALFVNPVVVAETIWVLERVYKTDREIGRKLLSELLETVEFVVPASMHLEGWSEWFQSRHQDFSDVLIAGINRDNGCSATVTFDREAAKSVPGMELLS